MRPISNLNSVLVKNYGYGSDILAVLRELKKLGVIKGAKSKSKSKSSAKMIEDIKQQSDMIGYVKNLAGEPNRLNPNLFALRQIEPGMSQQQIENIQRTNAAQVAALQGELRQNRRETEATIGGLAGAASQRFSQINNVLGQIVNPETERFRGSTFPAQATGIDPIDPFATRRPGVIYLGDVPDTTDVPMDQSINEGGPDISPEFASSTFPIEETGNIPSAPLNLQPREKVGGGGGKKRTLILDPQDVSDVLNLGKIPTMKNSFTAVENYYIALTDATDTDRDASLNSKSQILADIKKILEQKGRDLLL
jgi:hypothetical protein